MADSQTTWTCNCRQPGLGGDCDGSCTHPPQQPCERCGGDGGFDEVVGHDPHGPVSQWFRCRACGGTGYSDIECERPSMEEISANG